MTLLERTLAHLSGTLEQAEQTPLSDGIDPRVKVIGALLVTIAAVSCSRFEVLCVLLPLLTAVARLAGIPWGRLVSAWSGGLFFAAVVAVPAVFTSGWKLALLLVLRSEASLTCWLLVIMTTPFNLVLRALRALAVPVVFVAILGMTFRYIFLLIRTAEDMLLSRRSRMVGRMSAADNRKLVSSTAGVLLGKTVQMSDDVYQAMTSRGFRGEIQVLQDFQMLARDWVALGSVAAVAGSAYVLGR